MKWRCLRAPMRHLRPWLRCVPELIALLLLCTNHAQAQAVDSTIAAQTISSPYKISRDLVPGDTFMGVRLLGALKLDAVNIGGHLFGGLSALGWDEDEQLLYALSDRGYLFHLRIEFDDNGFLHKAHVLSAHALLDSRNRALKGHLADSEGLTVLNGDNAQLGDSQLAISFERRPRVLRFDPFGKMLGSQALPARLRNVDNYSRANRALESITWHPALQLLTAPEQPMRDSSASTVPLYALGSARHWQYPLAAEPNAGLTAIEALQDGSILTLERGFGVFFVPVISTLRRIDKLPDDNGALLAPRTIARFNSGQGWFLDNFEGLTAIGGGRILIISDDNTKALQSSLLAAFQLLDTKDPQK